MIQFDLHIGIYQPVGKVFSFVIKPENDFHWQYGTLMSAQISQGELGVGGLFRAVGHFMGRRLESVYEVTEFELNKKYGFRSKSSSIESYTLYTFETIKYSTRINAFAQIEPGSTPKSSETVMAKTIKKQYRENLTLLKEIMESNSIETNAGDMSIVPRLST